LQVESVAWITERKDVLSTFFGLLALHAYAGYAQGPFIPRYLLIMFWFALSLLAKPMLVTLPFAMLLLDFWPLNRWRLNRSLHTSTQGSGVGGEGLSGQTLSTQYSVLSTPSFTRRVGKLLLEKLPLLALALAASLVTIVAQRHGDAVRTLDEFSI